MKQRRRNSRSPQIRKVTPARRGDRHGGSSSRSSKSRH